MKRLIVATLICLAAGLWLGACDDDEEVGGGGLGWTGDVGVECTSVCGDPWCTNNDQMHCASGYCVGPQGETYCSVPCDIDVDCPDDYICTTKCDWQASANAICVKSEDYSFLRELGYCP